MTNPTAERRWYRLTPDRFVIGLLVVECLLWLSERFQWFPFNMHKGWTVLIAVAVVGAAFLLMLLWFIASLLVRWRFRALLVLSIVMAMPCVWLVVVFLFWLLPRFTWFLKGHSPSSQWRQSGP